MLQPWVAGLQKWDHVALASLHVGTWFIHSQITQDAEAVQLLKIMDFWAKPQDIILT
jgi:hypothetical protein